MTIVELIGFKNIEGTLFIDYKHKSCTYYYQKLCKTTKCYTVYPTMSRSARISPKNTLRLMSASSIALLPGPHGTSYHGASANELGKSYSSHSDN